MRKSVPCGSEPGDPKSISRAGDWARKALAALASGLLAMGVVTGCSDDQPPTQIAPQASGGDRQSTVTNSIGMELVQLPAGRFWMGSPAEESERATDESPRHQVTLSQPGLMGRFEVTQRQFQHVMGHNPSRFQDTGPAAADAGDLPVENVSWREAVEFCRQLSARKEERSAGREYRLPTEAEWEYACRAGTETATAFGPALGSNQANFDSSQPYGDAPRGQRLGRTNRVGSYAPNVFGLYDTHGNVWEWCSDYYQPDYYRQSPEHDPAGPTFGAFHVLRGGSWESPGSHCRSAYRNHFPDAQRSDIGFRVWCTISGSRHQRS
jgi:formylglycine-generating enzyme required for sulfatase activity